MNHLTPVLDETRAKIERWRGKNLGEAQTKVAIINPVLCALGWNVENPEDVLMEYKADTGCNAVDYALLLDGKPKLLVEAKALDQPVTGGRWADAIMGYAGTAGVKWVVLTNGDEYHIYDASAPVRFEEKLFRPTRLSDPTSPAEETLLLLSKQRIGDIDMYAEEFFDDRQVRAAIEQLLSPHHHRRLVPLVKRLVSDLSPKRIRASLSRVCAQVTFVAHSTPGRPEAPTPVPCYLSPPFSVAQQTRLTGNILEREPLWREFIRTKRMTVSDFHRFSEFKPKAIAGFLRFIDVHGIAERDGHTFLLSDESANAIGQLLDDPGILGTSGPDFKPPVTPHDRERFRRNVVVHSKLWRAFLDKGELSNDELRGLSEFKRRGIAGFMRYITGHGIVTRCARVFRLNPAAVPHIERLLTEPS